MAHIPIFHNPFGFQAIQQVNLPAFPMAQTAPNIGQVQFIGGLPLIAAIQPTIQHVGCVFLTRRGCLFDLILAHSRKNAFEVFGGDIQPGTSPRDCMNSLLRNIGFHATRNTPYFDMTNPADGKLTRIYVIFADSMSCTSLNQIIQANPVIFSAFQCFVRFPIAHVLSSPHSFSDDRGNQRNCTTFARSILTRISQNYLRYI